MERFASSVLNRTRLLTLAVVFGILMVASVLGHAQEPKMGGVLRVAIPADPPTLDVQATTAHVSATIGWHVFESLFTYDENYQIVPLLVSDYDVSDDGTAYTFRLRQGVKFHDGQEMTSADVVASLERWLNMSQVGGEYIKPVLEALVASDKYTVELRLSEPSGVILSALAQPVQMAVIYPERVAKAAPDGPIEELIGTGPFSFVEWRPNQHIRLARFADYTSPSEPPNGYAGRRTAYVDELQFLSVPEVSTRLAGVQTGTYHFATDITTDLYPLVAAQSDLVPLIVRPYGWPVAIFNKQSGLMTNVKIRQAFLAALDMNEIMAGTFGNPLFYRLDSSLMFAEQPWWSDAGSEFYNQKDPERARRLLEEAGYNGEPVRWLTSQEYDWAFRPTLIATEQLQRAGFTVELQVVDWATVFTRRSNPDLYDVFITSFIFSPGVAPPSQPVLLNANYPGWWTNERKEELVAELVGEPDEQRRLEIWGEIQGLFYEDVPAVKFGDFFNLGVARQEVQGYQNASDMFFWNVWLDR